MPRQSTHSEKPNTGKIIKLIRNEQTGSNKDEDRCEYCEYKGGHKGERSSVERQAGVPNVLVAPYYSLRA